MNDGIFGMPFAWLVPFLLLGLRERDSYGHELAEEMSDFGLGATRPGATSRTLRQMEVEGLVASERDGPDDLPLRRLYSITESGQDHLEVWVDSLARYQEEVDLFMAVYAGKYAGKVARGLRG